VKRIQALGAAVGMLAAGAARAQVPLVGDINLYGLRKVSQERILRALKVQPGERLPPSRGDMEDRVADISGVVLSRVEAVCCDGPRVTLFIGIEERGAPHATFRSEPTGEAVLPAEFVEAYAGFLAAVEKAAAAGRTGEDLSAGHSLMDDPQAWAFQKHFLEIAPANLKALDEVLRNASDPGQRAIAAALIGYAPNKADAIDGLQYALQDPDEAVRANALRSVTAIAVLASRQPALGLRIAPTWLVEALNSIVLSDRMEAVKALLALTDEACPGTAAHAALELVRERALPAVVEMARWKTPGDALPPFLLAGRLAGMAYLDILQEWATGNREAVLSKALGSGRRKAGGTLQ
jgi:hypothetical protein